MRIKLFFTNYLFTIISYKVTYTRPKISDICALAGIFNLTRTGYPPNEIRKQEVLIGKTDWEGCNQGTILIHGLRMKRTACHA